MALAGMASASTVITFGGLGTEYDFVTDAYTINDTASGYTATLSDGNSLTLTNTGGKFWGGSKDGAVDGTWSNTAALTDLNTTLGTEYTEAEFSSGSTMYFTAPGNSGSGSTLTFDFSSATVGDSITMYAMVTAYAGNVSSFSVTGLDNLEISYASNSGDGFSSTATFSDGAKQITMIKITGEITENNVVLTPSQTNKSGFQSVAYQIVPEPSTAALSLLALAGLVVRRRRK